MLLIAPTCPPLQGERSKLPLKPPPNLPLKGRNLTPSLEERVGERLIPPLEGEVRRGLWEVRWGLERVGRDAKELHFLLLNIIFPKDGVMTRREVDGVVFTAFSSFFTRV